MRERRGERKGERGKAVRGETVIKKERRVEGRKSEGGRGRKWRDRDRERRKEGRGRKGDACMQSRAQYHIGWG